jgi:ParB-like chromosome segregation protein Spo0J
LVKLREYKLVKLADLREFPNNPRTHSAEQITEIVLSIQQFGFNNPILIDETNTILAGHGRYFAAKKLKLKDLPCVIVGGLTDEQKLAYVIADNKLALNADWDYETLCFELDGLRDAGFDITLTGFKDWEIDSLFNPDSSDEKPKKSENKGTRKSVECPNCGEEFEPRK